MNINWFQILLKKLLKYQYYVYLIFTFYTSAFSSNLPTDLQELALTSIDLIYKENLRDAEDNVKRIIKKYPDHPAGYFFMAVVLDSWMLLHQSDKKEDEFYKYCDLAIEKGKKLLSSDPKNEWAKFFIGGADGYKGTYEARFERWITAFRYGWKGVSVLIELENSGCKLTDINYGIGSYEYWRSAMMKILWWMPGVDDKRESGILRLREARTKGIFTKISASVSLIDILQNEKRFIEALAISDEYLKVYPTSTFFLWGRAKSLYGLQDWNEATKAFRFLLQQSEAEPIDGYYNAANCILWLAKIQFENKQFAQCVAQCDKIVFYEFSSETKKRLQKCLSELSELRQKALKNDDARSTRSDATPKTTSSNVDSIKIK